VAHNSFTYALLPTVSLHTFIVPHIFMLLSKLLAFSANLFLFLKDVLQEITLVNGSFHSKYILTKNPSSLYWLFLNMPIFTALSIDRLYNERIKKSSIFFYTNFRDSTNGRIKTYSKNPLKSCSKCYNIPPCHSCTF